MKNYLAIGAVALVSVPGFRNINTGRAAPLYQQYKALKATSDGSLEGQVQNGLKDGWCLVGGVSVNNYKYAQAVAR